MADKPQPNPPSNEEGRAKLTKMVSGYLDSINAEVVALPTGFTPDGRVIAQAFVVEKSDAKPEEKKEEKEDAQPEEPKATNPGASAEGSGSQKA